MIIVVNGESREVAEGLGLTDLLREMELPPEQRGIAVARNGDVVLRASWPDTTLRRRRPPRDPPRRPGWLRCDG